jgi:hypothetical protein
MSLILIEGGKLTTQNGGLAKIAYIGLLGTCLLLKMCLRQVSSSTLSTTLLSSATSSWLRSLKSSGLRSRSTSYFKSIVCIYIDLTAAEQVSLRNSKE